MTRTRSWLLMVGAAAVLVLPSGSAEGSSAAVGGWARADLKPVTQPAASGDRFVLLTASQGRLRLLGLDARTGATVWSHGATASDITPGVPAWLVVLGDTVFYLRDSDDSLAAADVRTGRLLWHGPPGSFASWPTVCLGDPRSICVTGSLRAGALGPLLRFDARSGKVTSTRIAATGDSRELAPGLFDAGSRGPERVVATTGSATVWSRPLAKLFPVRGASTDWGWNFDRVERNGLFVGSVGTAPTVRGGRTTFHLSRFMTAGFRIRDGSVVWRSPGRFYYCSLLPCAGGRAASSVGEADAHPRGPTIGVRIHQTGTLSVSSSRPKTPSVSDDANVLLEGFDPATGRTTWSFDAGRNEAIITRLRPLVRLGDTVVALRRGARFVALDLKDGSRRPIAATAAGWCSTTLLYKAESTDRVGQDALFPCSAAGKRTSPPPAAPPFIAAIVGRAQGLVAWSDTRGVFAARAG